MWTIIGCIICAVIGVIVGAVVMLHCLFKDFKLW